MKAALIYAGTTEGRRLAERLAREGIAVEACVCTEYGEQVFKGDEGIRIHKGRLSAEEMRELYAKGDYFVVVDCTHPFATEASKNIRKSLADSSLPYFRVSREWENPKEIGKGQEKEEGSEWLKRFQNAGECAEYLARENSYQRIFLTTGSKELPLFCEKEGLKDRLVVRVLPGRESMEICWSLGLSGKQIIAMQGASTKEMNLAVIRQYGVDCLVTKESGKAGGEGAKIEAAQEAGIPCLMIQRPVYAADYEECSEEDAFQKVLALAKCMEQDNAEKPALEKGFQIVLAGMGMGDSDSMTVELQKVLEKTDYLFGAPRLLEGITGKSEKFPYYLARDILPKLRELQEGGALKQGKCRVTVLFSGDSGFYSGCKKLREALEQLSGASVTVLPGISSIAAFGAKIGEDWQDALIVSAHGVKEQEWAAKMIWGRRLGRKVFLLTSGPEDIRRIGELLIREKCEEDTIWVGYQLSYEKEKVKALTPRECLRVVDPGLYVAMILPENQGRASYLSSARLAPYLKDEEFCRGKVPMTKEEVRQISICKLGLWEGATVYDIGSGTGSIAVQMAALSGSVKVYAIEQEEEAANLIRQNKEQFGLENMTVVEGMAPEAMADLPTPTHAFIGGSKGKLREILKQLYQKNKEIRIVLNAVSLEGMMQAQQLIKEFSVRDLDIATVQVSKAKKVGEYHLMTAANPVTIFSFSFQKE